MFALLAVLLTAAPVSSGPTIIENDYATALAKAKAQKKLLFVDAWAPWCHSCVYMKEHVVNQPAFAKFQKDIVFASIDTERGESAAFLEKFPVSAWPTLFFIDPSNEALRFKWLGTVDARQMAGLVKAAKHGTAADGLFAKGDAKAAADSFIAAHSSADADARATMSLLSALSAANEYELCATTAAEQAPKFEARADQFFAATAGLGCALSLDPSDAKKALVTQFVALNKQLIASPTGLLADDVSSAYEMLVEERAQANDEAGAVALATEWLVFLDGHAATSKTPAARAAYDAHRTGAAIASKRPAAMVGPLQQSEKDFPLDYNPPARLALLFLELNKLDDAEAAIARALSKCEGPRKLRLFTTQAKVSEKRGDTAAQKKSLEAALAYAKALPRAQQSDRQVSALQTALAKVK